MGVTPSVATATKFDPTQAISMGLNILVGTIASQSDAKKRRQLEESLAKLSLAQQKELNTRMQDVQSDTARLGIMYQTFAVLENQKLVDSRKNKQLIVLGILGGGILLLVGLGMYYKRK
jgi:hypothetical protein